MDCSSEILDEIALEGLDGITLDGLWLRLSERPSFTFSDLVLSDDETKIYLFRLIRRLRDVKFYKLHKPRKPLGSVTRYAVDPELGVITEVDPPPEDLYPYNLINDTKKNVVGSCSTYDTRSDITKTVRRLEYSVANDTYGNCLVIVASQRVRKNSLTGLSINPNLDLVPAHFCILERLGRARYHGEPTQGKSGLAAIGEDSKTNFYLRKYLLKKNLITKQVFKQKSVNNLLSGLLLHLPRFYILVKPKFVMLTENVIKFLKEQPNQLVDYCTLQAQLPGVIKRLTKIPDFQKFVRTDVKVPYRLLYPNASVKQWKHKSSDKEKKIRIMQLRDPYVDLRSVQKSLLGNCEEDDEEEEKSSGILLDGSRCIDIPLLTQVCVLLKDYGDEGLSQTEIAKKLGLSKVQARTTTKNIIKIGAVNTYMVDVGRQRVVKFCLKDWDELNKNKFFIEYNPNVKHKLITALHNQPSCSSVNRKTNENNESSESIGILNCSDFKVDIEEKFEMKDSEVSFYGSDIDKERLLNGYDYDNFDDKKNIEIIEHTNYTPNKSNKRKNNANHEDPSVKLLTRKKKPKLVLPVDKADNINNKLPSWTCENPVPVDEVSNNSEIGTLTDVGTDVTGDCTDKRSIIDKVVLDNTHNFVAQLMDTNTISNNSKKVLETNCESSQCEDNSLKTVEPTKESELEKMSIQVDISEDFLWLLPQTTKNDLTKAHDYSLKTSRLLKRSNIIMEAVNELKVISDIRKLAVLINESECKEGLPSKMDKKSLLRILYKLASNNHIKVYRAALKSGNKCMYVNFICHTSIKPDNQIINSSIEFNKLKFHTLKFNSFKSSVPKRMTITYEKRSSFCHFPKFDRMKILHKFLVYLVYNYNGNDKLDQNVVKSKINKDHQLTSVDLDNLPRLYLPKIDERMFVSRLPKYSEHGKQPGWCLMSDVLTRMPLSLFLQLVQIPYFIPDLDEYMNHPIKKHFLVNSLPPKIRNCITATRKYIFTIYDVMLKLAYIGLLQLGAHQNKEKDQVFSFINRNAILLDTTMSAPGYIKISPNIAYPVQRYKFDSMDNVESYWHNCWKICMNTRLGAKSHVMGTDVIMEHVHEKQDMIEATKAREFLETMSYDIGYIPGDKSGAAGFDSAMFAHLKRNWHKNNKPAVFGNSIKTGDVKKPLQVNNMLQAKQQPLKRKLPEILPTLKEKCSSNLVVIPLNKGGKNRQKKANIRIRRINPVSKSLHRKPFYDQVDKEALKRMSKLRVDWSVEEDRVLLICKIASAFICPHPRKINANMFLAYREVLHKQLQTSRNKTSRACQRRVAYMLRSSSTRHNVNLCIEELKQDTYITETYGNTLEFIKQEAQTHGKKIADMEYIWRDRFKSLVRHLLNNYSSNNFSNFSFNCHTDVQSANKTLIPDTLQEFHNGYNLVQVEKKQYKPKETFKPVANTNDIYSAVVNVTIHSTLSCNSDKTSWSYHLFCIYQQYPEKILRDTLNKLRGNQMVSYKKSYQVRNKNSANYYLPLSASPYQLSISYVNLMQTRYQADTFLESFETFKSLLESFNVCSDTVSNDCILDFDNKLYQLQSLTGGSTAAIIELLSSDVVNFSIDIPNQIVVLDPSIETKDESYTRLVQRYKDLLSNFKKDLTSSVLFQKHNYLPLVKDSSAKDLESPEVGDNTIKMTGDELEDSDKWATQNVAKTSSRIALYLLNENKDIPAELVPKEMDHVHDFFVVNSCTVFVKLLENYRIIMSDNKDKSVKSKVINSNIIKSTLQSIRSSAVFNNICLPEDELCSMELTDSNKKDEDIEDDKYRIIECDESTLNAILNVNFNNSDYCLVKLILQTIKDKKEIGLTSSESIRAFGNSFNVVNIIRRLIDLSFILRAGVVHVRFVYYLYARPWLLHSYRNVRSEKDSRVEVSTIKCMKIHDNIYNKKFKNDCAENSDDDDDDDKEENESNAHPSTSNSNLKLDCNVEVLNDNGKWKPAEKEDIRKLKDHKMSVPIRVVMRPWIRIDGTLNRRVLDAVLSSVLSHIMLNPGTSLSALQYRFLPAYQPQHIHEACEILIKLSCIYSYCVKIKSKPTLFSKPCNILIEESTGMEAESEIRYEGDKFAIINLGKFLETKPYSRDFMQCLIGK